MFIWAAKSQTVAKEFFLWDVKMRGNTPSIAARSKGGS